MPYLLDSTSIVNSLHSPFTPFQLLCNLWQLNTSTSFKECLKCINSPMQNIKEECARITLLSDCSDEMANITQNFSDEVSCAEKLTEDTSNSGQHAIEQITKTNQLTMMLDNKIKEANQMNASINDFCNKISKAITTITKITAHTNLLALNATIESARGGLMVKASQS